LNKRGRGSSGRVSVKEGPLGKGLGGTVGSKNAGMNLLEITKKINKKGGGGGEMASNRASRKKKKRNLTGTLDRPTKGRGEETGTSEEFTE